MASKKVVKASVKKQPLAKPVAKKKK